MNAIMIISLIKKKKLSAMPFLQSYSIPRLYNNQIKIPADRLCTVQEISGYLKHLSVKLF